MIEHAAQIPEINPSAARFALDEMLGFVLVRLSVLGNIFSARDLHSSLSLSLSLSLFNLCFPNACFARRIEHPLDIPIESPQHADARVHRRSAIFCGHDQRLDRGLPRLKILFGPRKSS
jgi:hypothetical protein